MKIAALSLLFATGSVSAITDGAVTSSVAVARAEIMPAPGHTFVHDFGHSLAQTSTDGVLGSLGSEYTITNDYTSKHNGVRHVYFQQMINGIPVQNGVGSMNIDKEGGLVSLSHTFFPDSAAVPVAKAYLSGEAAVKTCMRQLMAHKADCASDVAPTLAYVQLPGGLELSYRVECDLGDNWMESYVSAGSGRLVAQIDYVDGASESAPSGTYDVYGIPDGDPDYGPNVIAFQWPNLDNGWHDQGNGRTFTDTRGNNVYAQENLNGNSQWENNYRPDGGQNLTFTVPYDLALEPPVQPNLDNAIANLFYWNNLIHDLTYGYGFDEEGGNFQENNFGRGGREGDAVQANAQDGAGTNNANFATPGDGSRGRMRMYVWTGFSPFRDGDIDAGIIYHEYGHGISNRLTGGPTSTGCLSGATGGAGMGEGWSDWFGKMIVLRPGDDRNKLFPMADYIRAGGLRNFPYTSDMEANPLTFRYMGSSPYSTSVHAAGTIWCSVLWEVMWNLIETHGYDTNNFVDGTGGNNIMTQLIIDGMKLQPCRPSMIDARDAIIMADQLNYEGVNYCDIWRGFAKRGMGTGATGNSGENFDTPDRC